MLWLALAIRASLVIPMPEGKVTLNSFPPTLSVVFMTAILVNMQSLLHRGATRTSEGHRWSTVVLTDCSVSLQHPDTWIQLDEHWDHLYHKNGAYFTYHHLLDFLSKTLTFNLNFFFVQTWLRQTMIWLFIIKLKTKDGEWIITNLFHKTNWI